MSTHLPEVRSFFSIFASFCVGKISHHQHKGCPTLLYTHRWVAGDLVNDVFDDVLESLVVDDGGGVERRDVRLGGLVLSLAGGGEENGHRPPVGEEHQLQEEGEERPHEGEDHVANRPERIN